MNLYKSEKFTFDKNLVVDTLEQLFFVGTMPVFFVFFIRNLFQSTIFYIKGILMSRKVPDFVEDN